MADELQLIEAWLVSTLAADTTLIGYLGTQPATVGGQGIFTGSARQGAVFPVVIVRYISPIMGDLYVNGARRVWTRARYEIVGAYQGDSYSFISRIASRIDTLISIKNTVAVTGGNILQCIREAPLRRPSFIQGQDYRELGASWDVIAQAA